MSLPLRFKAVCTETGKEFGVQELHRSIISLPVTGTEKADWFSWTQITVYQDIEDFIEKHNPELCQSTGLTDSQGKEVFFGDVLVNADKRYYVVEWLAGCFYLRRSGFIAAEIDRGELQRIGKQLEKLKVIGNRWKPIDTLKQRAGDLNG